jgi:hypothetical protein
MPPKKRERPEAKEMTSFINSLSSTLGAAEKQKLATEGRATQRRLNRYEYENALRDLLQAPWLQIRDALPEDGEAHRFNKVGDALELSREPHNPHDANAVVVTWRGRKLGYVPRSANAALSWALERGAPLRARISRLAAHPNPARRLEFEVFME